MITNDNGKGVLTISEARLEDAGAYSCEALNSKGRIFAIPDAIVYVLVAPGGMLFSWNNNYLEYNKRGEKNTIYNNDFWIIWV